MDNLITHFSAFGLLGAIILLSGLFLVLSGAEVLKVEKVSVVPGRKTWILGIFCTLVGISFLYWDTKTSSAPIPPTPDLSTPTSDVIQATPTLELTLPSDIKFNVVKESTNGCTVTFNGLHVDETNSDPLIWEWGDGNFTNGYFPQEHIYAKSGSYSVTVTAPSGLTKNFIIDVDCLLSPATNQPGTSGRMFFSLKNAKPEDFYTIKDGTFLFLDNGNLAIAGGYGGGTYINQPMPKNFRATIQLTIENPEDEFILGLSDGKEMRPNYHLVMGSKGTSFKQQLGFDITEGWDKYIKSVNSTIKPDYTYEVVFERRNGGINILVNNVSAIGLGASDVKDINSYDYLYLTGAIHQQVIIMNLVIDSAQ